MGDIFWALTSLVEQLRSVLYYRLDFYSEDHELYQKTLQEGGHGEELLEQGWLRIWIKADFEADGDFDGILFNLNTSQ